MRVFELTATLLVLFFGVASLFVGSLPSWMARSIALTLLLVLGLHLVIEKAHWQILPVYLASLFVLFLALAPARASRWCGLLCLLLAFATVAFSWVLPMFRLPKPTGPYAVGTRLFYMVDSSRADEHHFSPSGHRELMVQVWYPAVAEGKRAIYRRRSETTLLSSYQSIMRTDSYEDAPVSPAKNSYPLLIFNPAWTGQRSQNTFLMQELASHGYVVASIDHTYYSGAVAFPDGRVMDARYAPELGTFDHSTAEQERALGDRMVAILTQDDIFVLNQLEIYDRDPKNPLYQKLDMTRVAALGHSLGGATAEQFAKVDPRVRAALNLDGWTLGDVAQSGLPKPLMLMYESIYDEKLIPPLDPSSSESDKQYWMMNRQDIDYVTASLKRYGGYRLFVDGSSHWNFADKAAYSPIRRLSTGGDIDPYLAFSIVDRYALAFFAEVFDGKQDPILRERSGVAPAARLEIWPQSGDSQAVTAQGK